jgi:hypothetical protein
MSRKVAMSYDQASASSARPQKNSATGPAALIATMGARACQGFFPSSSTAKARGAATEK